MAFNRTLLIGAVVALLTVGIVGIGYAYTATTENVDNVAAPAYITVGFGDDTTTVANYTDSFADYMVAFDYKNLVDVSGDSPVMSEGIKFVGTMDEDGVSQAAVKLKAGESGHYVVDETGTETVYMLGTEDLKIGSEGLTALPETLYLTISEDGLSIENFVFWIGAGDDIIKYTGEEELEYIISGVTGTSKDLTITVYISVENPGFVGIDDAPLPYDADGATFTFAVSDAAA